MEWLIGYLIIMNLTGLFAMAVDKSRAKQQKWRVPEKTLFLISLGGGALGTWAGMYIYRHKTKRWYFVVGMPLILIAEVILLAYIMRAFP